MTPVMPVTGVLPPPRHPEKGLWKRLQGGMGMLRSGSQCRYSTSNGEVVLQVIMAGLGHQGTGMGMKQEQEWGQGKGWEWRKGWGQG